VRPVVIGALALASLLWASPWLGAQQQANPEPKRPSMTLKATPSSGTVPLRVFLSVELKGGDDNFEEYYCPTVEWTWGDGTVSANTEDCEPYEVEKSQIKRRYVVNHQFKNPGAIRVTFRLKKKDKVVGAVSTPLQLMGIAPRF
jgi:hypothetical protein